MQTNKIKAKDWQGQLNLISKRLDKRYIDLEVVGSDFESHFELKSIYLQSLNYDPKEDVVHIASDDFEHIIYSPAAIYFKSDDANVRAIESIEIVDSEDGQRNVTFEKPVLLS